MSRTFELKYQAEQLLLLPRSVSCAPNGLVQFHNYYYLIFQYSNKTDKYFKGIPFNQNLTCFSFNNSNLCLLKLKIVIKI
jgi:hypothetical protein